MPGHASQAQRSKLVPVRASEEQATSAFDYEEPETAKEGIDLGLVLCKQGRWAEGEAAKGECVSSRPAPVDRPTGPTLWRQPNGSSAVKPAAAMLSVSAGGRMRWASSRSP